MPLLWTSYIRYTWTYLGLTIPVGSLLTFFTYLLSANNWVYTRHTYIMKQCVWWMVGWRGGGWVVYIALIYLFRPFDILPLQNSVITSINTRIYARTVHITWFIVVCKWVCVFVFMCVFVCVCMHAWVVCVIVCVLRVKLCVQISRGSFIFNA